MYSQRRKSKLTKNTTPNNNLIKSNDICIKNNQISNKKEEIFNILNQNEINGRSFDKDSQEKNKMIKEIINSKKKVKNKESKNNSNEIESKDESSTNNLTENLNNNFDIRNSTNINIYKKIEKMNEFKQKNSQDDKNKNLNMNQNKKNLLDGNIKPSSSQKNFYNEIRKINNSLILDNIDSCKRFRKKNLFNEKNQSTKSIDNQNRKILETQRKPLICSGIFDNIKIRKINTNILNNKFTGYIPKMNNTEANIKTLIKVNIKRKKDIYSSSTNITKKNIKPNKKMNL